MSASDSDSEVSTDTGKLAMKDVIIVCVSTLIFTLVLVLVIILLYRRHKRLKMQEYLKKNVYNGNVEVESQRKLDNNNNNYEEESNMKNLNEKSNFQEKSNVNINDVTNITNNREREEKIKKLSDSIYIVHGNEDKAEQIEKKYNNL